MCDRVRAFRRFFVLAESYAAHRFSKRSAPEYPPFIHWHALSTPAGGGNFGLGRGAIMRTTGGAKAT